MSIPGVHMRFIAPKFVLKFGCDSDFNSDQNKTSYIRYTLTNMENIYLSILVST